MATLLQYRSGQLIPVKVDDKLLLEHYNQPSVSGRPVYSEIRKYAKRKKFYGSLIMLLLLADAALVSMAVRMFL